MIAFAKGLVVQLALPMYKVFGGLGGKGFELQGEQHAVIISQKKLCVSLRMVICLLNEIK